MHVDAKWTEFTLYHQAIRDPAGKLFAPPEAKGTWFGEERDPSAEPYCAGSSSTLTQPSSFCWNFS